MRLTIDVFIDTICPWCRMGTRSLLMALDKIPGGNEQVDVRWHAFQLNPGIQPDGENYREHMTRKLGGRERFEARLKQYSEFGKNFGLHYNMDLVSLTPNTILSHQLIALTPVDKQKQLIEELFTAYFEKGINIGDVDELVKIAKTSGAHEETALRTMLSRGEGLDRIEDDQDYAERLGINGVPFYVFDEKYSLSGLHSPDDFVKVIQRFMEEQ